jgi:hypothetical protein
VERWLGAGSIGAFPGGEGALQRLNRWAEEVADDELMSLCDEVAMGFSDVNRDDYEGLPVEVVVEWNHVLDIPT